MRVPTQLAYAFSAAAAITLLASCSAGSSPTTPLAENVNSVSQSAVPQVISGMEHPTRFPYGPVARQYQNTPHRSLVNKLDLPNSLVYVSYPGAFSVGVYDRNGKSLGEIAPIADPNGLFVDSNHNLWVVQTSWPYDPGLFPQMPTILEFARGATRASKTLRDKAGYPWDVTICPNGTVYVSNAASFATGGIKGGDIQVYASGKTKPMDTLSYPGELRNGYLTCDAAGNVFSTFFKSNHAHGYLGGVVEYPHGKQSGATLLPITITQPGGIKPDNAGNLLLVDQLGKTVCEYTEAGVQTGKCMATPDSWDGLAVSQNNTVVLGADFYNDRGNSLQFPSGMSSVFYPGATNPEGVAFDPGQNGI